MTDQRVAMTDFVDDLGRNRAAAGNVAEEFRDAVERVCGAMSEEEDGAAG
jgi:hypothetical protein